jgi:hypothetical protein
MKRKPKVYTPSMIAELRSNILLTTALLMQYQREYREAVGHEYQVPEPKLASLKSFPN